MTELTQAACHDTWKRLSSQFAARGDEFEDPIIIIASEIAVVLDKVRHAVPLFLYHLRDHVLRNVSSPHVERDISVHLRDCL